MRTFARERRILRTQALSELHQGGVLPDPATWRCARAPEIDAGAYWADLLGRFDGTGAFERCRAANEPAGERCPLSRLPGIALAGLTLGHALCEMLGGTPDEEVTAAATLLNVFVCLFDRVCDETPHAVAQLRASIGEDTLRAATSPDSPLDAAVFPVREDADLFVALTVWAAERYFRLVRAMFRRSGRAGVLRELQRAVLDAYDAELTSTKLSFGGPHAADTVRTTLRRKSSSIAWLMCLTAMLSPCARDAEPAVLRDAIWQFGDVFWIVDDIVDCIDDAADGRWSYPLLKFAELSPKPVLRSGEPGLRRLVDGLIETRVVAFAARELCERFHQAVEALCRAGYDAERTASLVRLGVQDWLDDLATDSVSPRPAPCDGGVREAIARALDFIAGGQRPDGGFFTSASPDPSMSLVCYVDSVYIPAYIARSIAALDTNDVAAATVRSALDALEREREAGGVWRFFGRASAWPPPDFDDTCCVLSALGSAGRDTESDVVALLNAQESPTGGYPTWVDASANAMSGHHVDGAVNANILLYAATQGIDADAAADRLNSLIAQRGFRAASIYAISPYPMIYLIARAYREGGVRRLAPSLASAVECCAQSVNADGHWGNELDTALALHALLAADAHAALCARAAAWLLERQRDDGGWPAAAFFQDFIPTYYGSEELTAALCAEALLNWDRSRAA